MLVKELHARICYLRLGLTFIYPPRQKEGEGSSFCTMACYEEMNLQFDFQQGQIFSSLPHPDGL